MIKTTIFTRLHRVSLAQFSLCWWRHNRLPMTSQLPSNCDMLTRIVISNSLDIDFIHSEIRDRSCTRSLLLWPVRSSWNSTLLLNFLSVKQRQIGRYLVFCFKSILRQSIAKSYLAPNWFRYKLTGGQTLRLFLSKGYLNIALTLTIEIPFSTCVII